METKTRRSKINLSVFPHRCTIVTAAIFGFKVLVCLSTHSHPDQDEPIVHQSKRKHPSA